jgi:methylenetetrahydrofolate dehydrogenase (NADP+)/methenyltetrahydrofolate cyclohydrolase
MTKIIDGKKISQKLKDNLKIEIEEIKNTFKRVPGLAVVQVGDVAASSVYVKAKTRAAKEVGITVFDHHLDASITQTDLLNLIDNLNKNEDVNGILVQLPLPKNINEQIILDSINPIKDADGFHPLNVGKLSINKSNNENLLIPCTPLGCLIMLKDEGIDLSGKNAVVIGRSNIVGKPMAQLLIKESCTVTIVHSKSRNIENICKNADILVVAIGKPEVVKSHWVKDDAIVIDVGINRINDIQSNKTKLVGDVMFDDVKNKVSAITPVPGGVGPMTIACLLKNTKTAFLNQNRS